MSEKWVPKVDREAVLRVMTKHLPAPHKIGWEMGQAADAILPLFTLEVDERALGDVLYDADDYGTPFEEAAHAVLEAAGLVRVDEGEK